MAIECSVNPTCIGTVMGVMKCIGCNKIFCGDHLVVVAPSATVAPSAIVPPVYQCSGYEGACNEVGGPIPQRESRGSLVRSWNMTRNWDAISSPHYIGYQDDHYAVCRYMQGPGSPEEPIRPVKEWIVVEGHLSQIVVPFQAEEKKVNGVIRHLLRGLNILLVELVESVVVPYLRPLLGSRLQIQSVGGYGHTLGNDNAFPLNTVVLPSKTLPRLDVNGSWLIERCYWYEHEEGKFMVTPWLTCTRDSLATHKDWGGTDVYRRPSDDGARHGPQISFDPKRSMLVLAVGVSIPGDWEKEKEIRALIPGVTIVNI
jgi:hypothetical protein